MPSDLPFEKETLIPTGCYRCDKQCITCRLHVVEGKTFSSNQTGDIFTVREGMTCETAGIIYLLFCGKCKGVQYVGETKNSLRKRFYLHRSNINENTGTHVTSHFNEDDHSLSDLRCSMIEKVYSNTTDQRLKREKFWIKILQTVFLSGLNSLEHS